MYVAQDWTIVDSLIEADLVQFTGGEDVSPHLYGEYVHPTTGYSTQRDTYEAELYRLALSMGIPMAGICRGGQFLNVMNGGKLYQDVDEHAIYGTHTAYLVGGLVPVQVSSTHHQMMRPNLSPQAECHILLTAKLAHRKAHMSDLGGTTKYPIEAFSHVPEGDDIEALYYASTNCLCFQPHPEFVGPDYRDMTALYFNLIEQYLFDGTYEDSKVQKAVISSGNFADA